jgi:DNA modification methylase
MKELKEKFPDGIFDLAFADPPYNLEKKYSKYEDDMEDMNYIKWCNEWLEGMYEVLKPGGALLVLNIPKWAVYHHEFLCRKMNFQHWIIWDALSTPAGKLMPAHYSLLYFTKPGGAVKSNYEEFKLIESRDYCLRMACIKKRKANGEDKKEKLSDIWKDVHRIKHKKDRDQHPCQLPIKLMNRIIKLFTNEGDMVYDPFGGAGSTAISAKLLNRNFIISELDKEYVEISNRNLGKIMLTTDGKSKYIRTTVNRKKDGEISKKEVEVAYLRLCQEEQKVLNQQEVTMLSPETAELITKYEGSFKKLMNICKRQFEAMNLTK